MIGFGQKKKGCISGDCNDGYGVYDYKAGYKYIGEWKNKKYHGEGYIISSKRSFLFSVLAMHFNRKINIDTIYSGGFKDGKSHGYGIYIFPSSHRSSTSKYVGEFKDGIFHGRGVFYCSCGNQFDGIFSNDIIEEGTLTFGKRLTKYEGAIYNGEFKYYTPHGSGEIIFINGDKYIGEFKRGRMHGLGKMTYANGNIEEGIWKRGKFKKKQK